MTRKYLSCLFLIFISVSATITACRKDIGMPLTPLVPTATSTSTLAATSTPTITNTPLNTFTPTQTFSNTATTTTMLTSTPTDTRTITMTFTTTATTTNSNTPTITNTPNGTFTPTNTPFTGPIGWCSANITHLGGTSISANVGIQVHGVPEITDTVFFTDPDGNSVTIGYNSTFSECGASYAYYSGSSSTLPYKPGRPYSFTTITSGGSASATCIGPGGSIAVSPTAHTCSWTYDGSYNFIRVVDMNTATILYDTTTGGTVNTPQGLPTFTSTNYDINVVCENWTYGVSNTVGGLFTYLEVSDYFLQNY